MYPAIFQLVEANAPAKVLLGSNPVRLYPFGEAPQGVVTPYAVWQTAYGAPENLLNQAPVEDSFGTQVDVYAETATSARDTAKAICNALEGSAYVTAWRGESIDPATKRYRYSFDVEFLTPR